MVWNQSFYSKWLSVCLSLLTLTRWSEMILGRGGHDITSAIVCALRSKISPFCSHTKTCKDWFFFSHHHSFCQNSSTWTLENSILLSVGMAACAREWLAGTEWKKQERGERGECGERRGPALSPCPPTLWSAPQMEFNLLSECQRSSCMRPTLFFFHPQREPRVSLSPFFSLSFTISHTH